MSDASLYLRRLNADKWMILLVAAVVSAAGLWYAFVLFHPVYESTAKLWLRSSNTIPYITSIETDDARKPISVSANPILTQIELMTSAPIAKDHIAFIRKIAPQAIKAGTRPERYIKEHFRANNVVSSETVQLMYKSPISETVAQAGLSQLIQSYLQLRQQIESGGRHEQRNYLDQKLKEIEDRLISIRQKIRRYETSTLASDLTTESGVLVNERVNTESRLSALKAQIASNQASVRELSRKMSFPNAQAAINAVALGAEHNPLHELRAKLDEAKQELAFDAIKLAPTNPRIVAEKQKITAIQAQIDAQIRRTLGHKGTGREITIYDDTRAKLVNDLLAANVSLKGFLAQKSTLEKAKSDVHQAELALPAKRYNLKNLQQEETNLALAYDELKKKQMESRLKEADVDTQSVVIMDPPSLPDQPAFPNRTQLAALTILLGLLSGVFVSMLKTRITGFCSDPVTMSDITQRPILASVPWFSTGYKQTSRLLAIESASDEAIARLLLVCREHHYQVLALTSDCQGAHRPTLIMQLGRKLADSGYRVALLDTNFRWPTLACRVDIHPEQSLSNLIDRFQQPISPETADAIIAEYAYTDNDTGVTCFLNEQPLSTPARYLASPGFERLLMALRQQYDLILINTPSLLNAPEAATVAALSDAVVLATSYAVKESEVLRMTSILEDVQRPFLGTIIRARK